MEVRIIKGTNQIGGCITEISTEKSKIIIDFGCDLDEEKQKELFEVEGLTNGIPQYDAVFITHSHGDHIGLVNQIMESIPIYIEEVSLRIHNITCDFCYDKRVRRKINQFKLYDDKQEIIEINDGDIKITPYRIDHSSYNSCMFLIESEGKRILHTGDFRLHGRKKDESLKNIEKIGKVDLLITEGTTLSRSNYEYITEEKLEEKIEECMRDYSQVFIMQSSTNVDRTQTFIDAAKNANKKFVFDLFSYWINENLPNKIPVDYENVFVYKTHKYNKKPIWFRRKYMKIKTSSSFVPYYAMNIKQSMIDDVEKNLYNKGYVTKACLIYSMWDGYIKTDEKLNTNIERLKSLGIKYVELHTSGHADIKAMETLNRITNPDKTIIIHTEAKEKGRTIFNNVLDIEDLDKITI